MQFMTPHIKKKGARKAIWQRYTRWRKRRRHSDDDAPNENVPESITSWESPTVIQAACRQSNQDDCKQRLVRKLRRLIALDPVDTCFVRCMKQQTQSKTADPDEEFLQSTP
jgi:hypothetical protein